MKVIIYKNQEQQVCVATVVNERDIDIEATRIAGSKNYIIHDADSLPIEPTASWVIDVKNQRIIVDEVAKIKVAVDIANQQKKSLLQQAAAKISIFQDAIDLDMATDVELEQYKNWRKYRVLLDRIDTSTAPDINWPQQPE